MVRRGTVCSGNSLIAGTVTGAAAAPRYLCCKCSRKMKLFSYQKPLRLMKWKCYLLTELRPYSDGLMLCAQD